MLVSELIARLQQEDPNCEVELDISGVQGAVVDRVRIADLNFMPSHGDVVYIEATSVGAVPAQRAPTFAEDLQTARDGFAAMRRQEGEIGEILGDGACAADPFILGQLLMESVPVEGQRMSVAQKAYWAGVADHMGPDYLPGLRHAVAFADKVESF